MKTIKLSRLLLMVCLCAVVVTAKAQYVSIPDTLFSRWLNTNGYTSCLTGNGTVGWHLDTTCSAVLTATTISCNSYYPYIKECPGGWEKVLPQPPG